MRHKKEEMIVPIEKIAFFPLSNRHTHTHSYTQTNSPYKPCDYYTEKNKYQPMRWNYNTFIYTVEKIGHLWRGILPEIKKEFDFFCSFCLPTKA